MGLTLNQETSDRVSEVATDHPFSLHIENTAFHQWVQYWNLAQCFGLRKMRSCLSYFFGRSLSTRVHRCGLKRHSCIEERILDRVRKGRIH